MSTVTYKSWLATKQQMVAAGDVADYLAWYAEHPSPLGGLFGRPLTKPEIVSSAIASVAHSFKGTKVLVRFSETPEASAKWISEVTGTLVGQAHVATGSTTQEAVAIQTDHALMVIPVRNITDMENHDARS